MSNKKNIVIAPCGNKSFLFYQSWLKSKGERNFDVCLLFYHDHIDNPSLYKEVDYFFHLKDFKYKMLYEILINIKSEWLEEYDYFYFLDDDIDISTKDINRMFDLSLAFDTSISCAALSDDSFCSWPIFRQNKNCFLRFVGQIEVMAPLFSKEALKICLPIFIGNRSSWGLDAVWSKLLDYPEDKLIVFDAVVMKHTLPVGGGELYVKIGVDPHNEWVEITQKHGAKLQNYREYGRLQILHQNSDVVYKFQNDMRQNVTTIQRKIRDFDVGSRVKNKWNKIFGSNRK